MKRYETALVLAKIAAIDNRRLDDPAASETPIIDAWHDLLGDLTLQDCLDAVATHRKRSTEWIQPAHIRAIVQETRSSRRGDAPSFGELTADIDPHDIPAYLATLRHRMTLVADGVPADQAKATPPPPEARHAIVDRTARPVITAGAE